MSKPLTYSASQIEAWEDCPRKWGWDKIDSIRRADTAATKLGTAVHNQLERYLKGEPFDFASDHHAAQLAQGATPFLPAPRAYGLAVEAEDLQFPSPTYPHLWTGRIDWYLHAPGKLTIGDHKTTSSIAKWAKSTIVLRRDVQANIYAKYGLIIRPDLGEIELQWTYIQTRDARLVEPRKLTVLHPEVESRFAEIDATANEITIARQGIQTAKDLPYNSDSCDKYGGCSYQHLCNLSPLVQLRSFMSNSPNNDFLAKMQALQGGVAPGAQPVAQPQFQLPMAQAPAPIAQAPAPHADLGFMAVRDEHGRVIKSLTGKPLPEQVIMTQHVQNPETGGYLALNPLTSIVADLLEKAASAHAASTPAPVAPPAPTPPVQTAPSAPSAWTPPGAPVPPPAAFQPPAAPPPVFRPPVTGPINPPEWNPPTSPTAANPLPAVGLPTPPVQTAPPEAPKRGRPKGSKNKAPEANAPTTTEPAVALQDHQIIGTLYLGCRPMDCNERTFDIQDFILDANNRIAKELNVPDYTLLDFGKGAGTLLAFVQDIVATQYRGCDLIVDLDSREAPILSAALAARAVNVIRRF